MSQMRWLTIVQVEDSSKEMMQVVTAGSPERAAEKTMECLPASEDPCNAKVTVYPDLSEDDLAGTIIFDCDAVGVYYLKERKEV